MVKFSSSLDDKQGERRNRQIPDDFELEYSRLTERPAPSNRPVY